MAGVMVVNNPVDPFVQERLAPEHLALLFPATFYENDESLALHLTESCLVETTTWDGDSAIGETAFWLKVLSTPQTDYLRQQKRLFKSNVAKAYKQFTTKQKEPAAVPTIPSLPTVIELTSGAPQHKKQKMSITPKPPAKSTGSVTLLVKDQANNGTSVAADGSLAQKTNQSGLDAAATGFGLNSYKCKLCVFATDTREKLNIHQKNNHAAERPYGCEYCDYTSRYPWNIKTHVDNVHLKTKRFKCEHCDFYSPQACLLKRHVTRVHTNAKDVKCPYCDYRANHKDVLKRHVHMKHTGEFDHKCPYCPYGRDAKYEVEDHINAVHLKQVVYQCSECSFQTYRKITLRSHHKDHETKQLLTCPECGLKSIYPSTMAKHIREEHPNTPIPAELKDARRKIEQKHIVGGDIDYTPVLMCKCKLCDFTCERISKLRAHVRRVHSEGSRNRCPVCKSGFANKRNLKNHVSKQHPGYQWPETQSAADTNPEANNSSAAEGVTDSLVAVCSSVDHSTVSDIDSSSALHTAPNAAATATTEQMPSTTSVTVVPNIGDAQSVSIVDDQIRVEDPGASSITSTETVLFLSDIANLEDPSVHVTDT